MQNGLRRTMFLLALPVLCEQFLSFGVGFVDTWLSGRLSADATTAVGFGAYFGWLASMLFALVGTGTTALVARHWGAGEFDDANRVMNRSIALASLMGIVVYGAIYALAPSFAHFLHLEGESGAIVTRYLRLDGIGQVFNAVTLAGAAALRGSGNMRTPMMILGLVNLLNMLVSAVLVYGFGPLPAIGIDGIVIGTVVARFAGGIAMLAILSKGLGSLRLRLSALRIRGNTVRRILKIGSPAAIDGMLTWAGQFVFLMVIANLESVGRNSDTFAAHMIGIRVEGITYLPAVAWGMAAATLVGQSLGANDVKRAVQSGHEAAIQCGILAALISILFFFLAEPIFMLMHDSESVRSIGVPAFRLMAIFQVPLIALIIYEHALHGAGDTKYPMLINVTGVFCIRVSIAYLFGIVWNGGLVGAWIGMFADVTIRAILMTARFVRGRWIHTKV